MDERCKTCEERQACIPFFAHENTMMHYNAANRRMLIALIIVCVTFIVTIVVFVTGYTAREKNWLQTLSHMTPVQEVADGVQQSADP